MKSPTGAGRNRRLGRWLLLVLVAAEVGLWATGRLSGTGLLVAIAATEVLLLAVVVWRRAVIVLRFRRERRGGADAWSALELGLATLLPRAVARLFVIELHLYASLGARLRWRGSGTDEFPYHARSVLRLLAPLAILTTPGEIVLFEVLLPWRWLRSQGVGEGLRLDPIARAARLQVGGEVDVTRHLRAPVTVARVIGHPVPVTTVSFAVDPAARLHERLAAAVAAAAAVGPAAPHP